MQYHNTNWNARITGNLAPVVWGCGNQGSQFLLLRGCLFQLVICVQTRDNPNLVEVVHQAL